LLLGASHAWRLHKTRVCPFTGSNSNTSSSANNQSTATIFNTRADTYANTNACVYLIYTNPRGLGLPWLGG